MATHINTANALKGLACVANSLVPVLDLSSNSTTRLSNDHFLKHLHTAGLEMERLNDEAIRLRKRIKFLEEFNSSFESQWDDLIFAVMGTEAGKRICAEGADETTIRAVSAIRKTEFDRKEALCVAQAFQETAQSPIPAPAPKTHRLKILSEYFQSVVEGRKKAELRVNDRDFSVGDYLLLNEWDNGADEYTGRQVAVAITDITHVDSLADNLVLLSFYDPSDEIPF